MFLNKLQNVIRTIHAVIFDKGRLKSTEERLQKNSIQIFLPKTYTHGCRNSGAQN